jgi:membrane-associated phospholipid phosphatase
MEALLEWGLRGNQAVQAWGNPTLDALFRAITMLGDEKFYLLLVPLLYWVVDKRLALRAGVLYLTSAYVNTVLKAIFTIPRPPATEVRVLDEATGYSFPSGHAQSTTTAWGYLAASARRRWLWTLTLLAVLLVGLSRVYLGVHYPQDVIAGTLVGAVLVALFIWLEKRIVGRFHLSLGTRLLLALVAPLILLLLHAETDTGSSMGTLLGLGFGVVLEREYVRFSTAGTAMKRALRFLLGIVVLVGLYFGLKIVFPAGLGFRVLRYGLIGLWASLLAPWVFVRTGLAPREEVS